MNILITNALLIVENNNGDLQIERGDIAVQEDRIIKVGNKGEIPQEWKADKVISGENKAVLPGFINTHTHAAMTLFRSYADDLPLMKWLKEKIWPLEEKLTKEDIYWGTMLAAAEMLKSGTTTFADMYFLMNDVARAVEDIGIRANLSRGMTVFAEEEALAQSRDFVTSWHNKADGRITTMLGPHAPYTTTPDFLKKVMQLSDEFGVGIHIHLAETQGENNDIAEKYGLTPIRLMNSINLFDRHILAAHVVYVDDEEIAILKDKNVYVAHNPESNMKLASGIAPITSMLKSGVNVSLGTDGAASNNNLDMITEMRSMALLQKVATLDSEALPASQALKIATSNGAKALGLNDIGKLAPGMKADIICIDYKKPHMQPMHNIIANIVYAAQPADVSHTIVNGNLVVEDGKLLSFDEEKILYNVQKCADRLLQG